MLQVFLSFTTSTLLLFYAYLIIYAQSGAKLPARRYSAIPMTNVHRTRT